MLGYPCRCYNCFDLLRTYASAGVALAHFLKKLIEIEWFRWTAVFAFNQGLAHGCDVGLAFLEE